MVGSVVATEFNPITVTIIKKDFRSVRQPVEGESDYEGENSSESVRRGRETEKSRDRESGPGLVTAHPEGLAPAAIIVIPRGPSYDYHGGTFLYTGAQRDRH